MEHSHENPLYPDLIEGDIYTPASPMKEVIYIDRDDYLDYPALLFDNVKDFQTAIATEQERTAKFFPNGVRFSYDVTKEGALSIVLTYYQIDNEVWTHPDSAAQMGKMGMNELLAQLKIHHG